MRTVYLLFALCFLTDPLQAIHESSRVLQEGGHLVIGMIPLSGPWGQSLEEKKKEGHPFYEYARFYDMIVVESWLKEAGFQLVEARSSLFQPPDSLQEFEHSRSGTSLDAGFWVLVARSSCSAGGRSHRFRKLSVRFSILPAVTTIMSGFFVLWAKTQLEGR